MTIKIPRNYMGEPIEGSMERILAGSPSPPTPVVQPNVNPNVNISTIGDYWQVSGVNYRNGVHTVDLAKTLLENGNAKTQNDWASYSESALAQNEFRTPDYPLFYGLVKALYSAKDDSTKAQEVEEAKKFLKDTSRAKWLMTLTRIDYQPNGEDIITHNFGTREKYEEKTDFVGLDGLLTDKATPASCKSLLGSDNVQEISDVFQWLNGTNTYIWRVNSRPNQLIEKVAGFWADSDWADLDCNRDPSDSRESLGVRLSAGGSAP